MNWSWLSFVVGLLVAWLIEWLIDFIYWRRRYRAQAAEIADLQRQQEDAYEKQRELEQQAVQCAQDLEACRAELEAAQEAAPEVETRAGEGIPLDLEPEAEKEDLTAIEGIGPKVQELLNEAGIVNYDQLAATPVSRLEEILDAAGPRYRMADPTTWPEQARLAADGKWDELQKYQDDLKGGRIEEEDLTKIEGIGPKIAGLLNEAGIVNYWQLSDTPVSRIQEILDAAGPRYQMADPSTWPEQARLADEEEWDELQAFQDSMSGGHAEREDLTKIEGIGPKIAAALNAAGITTFAQLKAMPVDEVRRILTDAGITGAFGDPTTWSEQARLAQAGKWDELQALQDRLKGGRV